jgi:hypothetical protein
MLVARVGDTPAERRTPLSPVKAWFSCWAGLPITQSLDLLGEAAVLYHQEVDRDGSYLNDPLDATAAGLICDLPLLAGHLEAAGEVELARALGGEVESLLAVFGPRWQRVWEELDGAWPRVAPGDPRGPEKGDDS